MKERIILENIKTNKIQAVLSLREISFNIKDAIKIVQNLPKELVICDEKDIMNLCNDFSIRFKDRIYDSINAPIISTTYYLSIEKEKWENITLLKNLVIG